MKKKKSPLKITIEASKKMLIISLVAYLASQFNEIIKIFSLFT